MTFRPTDPSRSANLNETDFSSRPLDLEAVETETVGSRLAAFYLEASAPTVLVVDDSIEIRNVLVWLLGTCGCRAITAPDGSYAKSILQDLRPALVLSDLHMPVCDGWELLSYCHERYPNLPVLIMSGDAFGSRPEIESLAAGLIAKPIDAIHFRSEVSRLISHLAPRLR